MRNNNCSDFCNQNLHGQQLRAGMKRSQAKSEKKKRKSEQPAPPSDKWTRSTGLPHTFSFLFFFFKATLAKTVSCLHRKCNPVTSSNRDDEHDIKSYEQNLASNGNITHLFTAFHRCGCIEDSINVFRGECLFFGHHHEVKNGHGTLQKVISNFPTDR